jgi:putative peptidoglycan lipid II flippase
LINVNAVIDTLVASRLIDPSLAPAAIEKAFRLYMLPQGLFSVAVATVLFPTFSRLAARGDARELMRLIGVGLRQVGFLLAPAAVVSAVLAVPITRLIYQRGSFTPEDTQIVAGCLAAFSLGLAFNGWMLVLNRAFFSQQSNWLPTSVALANLGLNAVLDLLLYRVGIWGIPLATSLVNVAAVVALLVALRRRSASLDVRGFAVAMLRVVGACVPLAAVAFAVWAGVDDLVGRSTEGQIVSLGAALSAGAITYLAICRLLGVREVASLRELRP